MKTLFTIMLVALLFPATTGAQRLRLTVSIPSVPYFGVGTTVERTNGVAGSYMTCPIDGKDARLIRSGSRKSDESRRLRAQAGVLASQGKAGEASRKSARADKLDMEVAVKFAGINPQVLELVPVGRACRFNLRSYGGRSSTRREVTFKFYSDSNGRRYLGSTTERFYVNSRRPREDARAINRIREKVR